MALPFAPTESLRNEIEIGAGGQRLGWNFMLDDGTLLLVGESEITAEIEWLMASLGSPTEGLILGAPNSNTPDMNRR